MKNSTAKSSSKAKVKTTPAKTYTLGGLVFPQSRKGLTVHMSLLAWVEAGKPDNVYIFDSFDNLKVCGIPICDAVPLNGLYRRIPVRPLQKAEHVRVVKHLAKPIELATVVTTVPGIKVAESKDHHKMAY